MTFKWKDLDYWKSGEWQVVDERLKDLDGKTWCPGRTKLFASLNAVPFDNVRVVICGQDPYPNPNFATGIAFSIPAQMTKYPPTLAMIIQELQGEVEDFTFTNGNLTPWCAQGVLLWNAIPSCDAWKSKSHHWKEYEPLTKEIFQRLSNSKRHIPFVFFGSTALYYSKFVNEEYSDILWTSHPSPRGIKRGIKPFLGSRIFSTINAKLEEFHEKPIDWRL